MTFYEPWDFQGLPEVEYEDNFTDTLENYANFQPRPDRPNPYATMTPDELWAVVDREVKAYNESQRKKEEAFKLLSPVAQARAKAKALAKKSARVKTRVLRGGRQLLAPLSGYAGLRKWDEENDEGSTARAGRRSAAGRFANGWKEKQMSEEEEAALRQANHEKIVERWGSEEELARAMKSGLGEDYASQTPEQIRDLLANETRLKIMRLIDINNCKCAELLAKLDRGSKALSVESETGSICSGGYERALAVFQGRKGTLDEDLKGAGWGAELDGEDEESEESEDEDEDSDGDWDSESGSEDGVEDNNDGDSDDDDDEEFFDALSRPPTPPAKVDPRDMWRLYGPEIEKTIELLTLVSKLQ